LNDITSGSNGSCSPASLCTAGPGYDGPTGLGTPNGLAAFKPPVPAVTSVSPSSGPTGGGTIVTITGTNLTGATAVTFGTTAATFTVNSSTQITASAPSGTGTVDVKVTTPNGTSATGPGDQFTYVSATITKVAPAAATIVGGTSVTITGVQLTGATQVLFGSTPAASFTVKGATTIVAVSPPEAAGTVDITVTTPAGVTPVVPADQFTYQVPAVTSINPASGTVAGGSSVVITGVALASASKVKFGTVAATFTVNSATQITAVSPPEAAGTVDITVTTSAGVTAAVAGDKFTFRSPAITSITPTSGPVAGGTSVTINGQALFGASHVFFGATPAASFSVTSANKVVAVSPPGVAGVVDITVVAPGGTTAVVTADRYTYS
jgi:hypothetical protein